MKEFNISASTVQWLTTGFLLVNGIMIPISAWLINSFSSKKLYLRAMGTFLIGTIICFIAQNFPVLLAGRLIQAVGVGLSKPLLQNIMLTIFLPEKRGSAMGMAGIIIGLAPALGPTLSGWIIDHYSWRDLFGSVKQAKSLEEQAKKNQAQMAQEGKTSKNAFPTSFLEVSFQLKFFPFILLL